MSLSKNRLLEVVRPRAIDFRPRLARLAHAIDTVHTLRDAGCANAFAENRLTGGYVDVGLLCRPRTASARECLRYGFDDRRTMEVWYGLSRSRALASFS